MCRRPPARGLGGLLRLLCLATACADGGGPEPVERDDASCCRMLLQQTGGRQAHMMQEYTSPRRLGTHEPHEPHEPPEPPDPHDPHDPAALKGHEGHEGHEGREGHEGHEGHEAGHEDRSSHEAHEAHETHKATVAHMSHAAEAHAVLEGHAGHEDHGGHKGHEGAKVHSGHKVHRESVALAWMFLGMVGVIMTLFYLLNWPDEDIQRETWKILSSTVSILCAVLLFAAVSEVAMTLMQAPEWPHFDGYHDPPPLYTSVYAFAHFVIILSTFCVTLTLVRRSWLLKPVGSLGAHVVGFAAIDAFGGLQQCLPFAASHWATQSEAMLSLLVMVALIAAFTQLRNYAGQTCQGISDNAHTINGGGADPGLEWEEFCHTCAEAEQEATSLAVGLLITQGVKYAIVGNLAPIHGYPRDKTTMQVVYLMACSLTLAVTGILLAAVVRHTISRKTSVYIKRGIHLLESINSITAGWCLLYTGQWIFWSTTHEKGVGHGDKMTARLIMALAFGFLAFVVIFLLDFLADHHIVERPTLKALVNTMGLLLGLSWEAVVQTAAVGVSFPFGGHDAWWQRSLVFMGLFVLVAPAWALYILPRSLEFRKELDSDSDFADECELTTAALLPPAPGAAGAVLLPGGPVPGHWTGAGGAGAPSQQGSTPKSGNGTRTVEGLEAA